MDLEQLRIFAEVYRARGFAAVAKARGVAPSSISRQVAGLEAALQVRLFQRSTRSLAPTEAGAAFHARIEPLIEELDAARAELADRTRGPVGRLRVTASVAYGQICIVPRLAAFRAAHPRITLDLFLTDSVVDLVAERIDVAIRHGVLADSALVARKLAAVRYLVVASPGYLAAHPPIRAPGDLAAHDCVTFPYDGFRDHWRFRQGGIETDVAIRTVVSTGNAAAIRDCARAGLGLALLADWTLGDDLAMGRLVEVLPDWQAAGASFDVALWAIFPSRAFVPAKVRAFVALLGG